MPILVNVFMLTLKYDEMMLLYVILEYINIYNMNNLGQDKKIVFPQMVVTIRLGMGLKWIQCRV